MEQLAIQSVVTALVGAVGGFVSSTPPGPANLWVARRIVSSKPQGISSFVAGVIAMNSLYAIAAVWGHAALVQQLGRDAALLVPAGVLLIGLGIWGLLRSPGAAGDSVTSAAGLVAGSAGPVRAFGLGAFLCGYNPAFIFFWLWVFNAVNVVVALQWDVFLSAWLTLGIAVGNILWFLVWIKMVGKGIDLTGPYARRLVQYGIAACFVVLGALALGKGFFVLG